MFGREPQNSDSRVPASLTLICTFTLLVITACGGPQERLRTVGKMSSAKELVGVWYTVEAGDTLESIASRHRVVLADIIELNGIVKEDQLAVGQPLFLFGVTKLVKRLDAKKKRSTKRARRKKGIPKLVWPLKGGVLTSGFGPRGRRLHKGIDIAVKPGTPIHAVAAGTVIYSDNKQRGYGNLVIIEHQNRVVSVYAHNRRNLVDEGDSVRQGAPIAEVGNTGRSTGPHLHFELRVRGKAVNPLDYLPAR